MKGKIIELKDDSEYIVLEEIVYNDKKYIMASECNTKTEEIIEEDTMIVMEIELDREDLSVADIYDDDLAETVSKLLLEKMQNSTFE